MNMLERYFYRMLRFPPRIAYALRLGSIAGRKVLLLTTTGRKSGRKRVTPLQYEDIDGIIHLGSARGTKADWYRNLEANPQVEVRVKNRCFEGIAETSTDPQRIADFLEYRLERHPRMIGAMMRMNGFPVKPNRQQLLDYASSIALVTIRPIDNEQP